MEQQTLSDIEYSNRRKITRREKFLDYMDQKLPWKQWVDRIRPFYPSGRRGRPPKDIETMLRMYLMQNWFHLSDAAMEDAIYDSYAMRKFMHLDFFTEQVPGATTLRQFRNLLKKNKLDQEILDAVKSALAEERLMVRRGMLVDAVLIALPHARK